MGDLLDSRLNNRAETSVSGIFYPKMQFYYDSLTTRPPQAPTIQVREIVGSPKGALCWSHIQQPHTREHERL